MQYRYQTLELSGLPHTAAVTQCAWQVLAGAGGAHPVPNTRRNTSALEFEEAAVYHQRAATANSSIVHHQEYATRPASLTGGPSPGRLKPQQWARAKTALCMSPLLCAYTILTWRVVRRGCEAAAV
jgi:hypothetical protein